MVIFTDDELKSIYKNILKNNPHVTVSDFVKSMYRLFEIDISGDIINDLEEVRKEAVINQILGEV